MYIFVGGWSLHICISTYTIYMYVCMYVCMKICIYICTYARFISKVMHTPPKINQIYSFKSIFTLSFNVVPSLSSMTHFQRSGSFLTPSSRPLEFSSQISQVTAKFRSFKVGKHQRLNGSFNFMAETHVWRIRRGGTALPIRRSPEEWSM